MFERVSIKPKIMKSYYFRQDSFENQKSLKVNADLNLKDHDLWKAFKEGNESAFVSIYEKNFDDLYNYGFKLTCDEELIKDCIQEMFIYIRKKRYSLSDTDNIKFYLFKAFKRFVLKSVENSNKEVDLKMLNENFLFCYSHESYLISRQIDKEKVEKINSAITKLSPRKREVIYYFFYENLSYNQIQELMGFENIKSVRNTLYKGLNLIKKSLLVFFLLIS